VESLERWGRIGPGEGEGEEEEEEFVDEKSRSWIRLLRSLGKVVEGLLFSETQGGSVLGQWGRLKAEVGRREEERSRLGEERRLAQWLEGEEGRAGQAKVGRGT
jgi:hypothetical protein